MLSYEELKHETLTAMTSLRPSEFEKKLRIAKDLFRNSQPGFEDVVMEMACGLCNDRSCLRSDSKSRCWKIEA